MSEPTGKRCCTCRESKELAAFGNDRTKLDGLNVRCKDCNREHARRWYQANPERSHDKQIRWRGANLEKARAASRQWNAEHPEVIKKSSQSYRESNPEAARTSARRQHATKRDAVFDHYGRSCACCGTPERLSIDHVQGDGQEHRAQIGMGSSHLYRWLVANGFPPGFQVLCRLCNKSKADGDRCRLKHLAA